MEYFDNQYSKEYDSITKRLKPNESSINQLQEVNSEQSVETDVQTLYHDISEIKGMLKSKTLNVSGNMSQANHFYEYDVVEGETYVVENKSPYAVLIIYISDTGDASYESAKVQCIHVPQNNTGIFVAPLSARFIGFYNNDESVDVRISHIGNDKDIADVSLLRGTVLSSELRIEETLPQYNHFYRFDIVAGHKYTIINDSPVATLIIYTSNTGETNYSSTKREYERVAAGQSLTIIATENARYIGFYNNDGNVNVTISHSGLVELETEVPELQRRMNCVVSTVQNFDYRISTSESNSIAAAKVYTDSAVLAVSPTNILWEQLSTSLQNRITGAGGTITNASDGEDLTTVNAMLKFANKDATTIQYGGKSRVFLRKNIVNGKNVLTPDMISSTNTLFILQYDYDLNGEEVTLGRESTIMFYGGSLNNGTLNYLNGSIIPACDSFFGDGLRVVTNEAVNISWYGVKSGDVIDSIIELLGGHTIIVPTGDYRCTKSGYVLAPNTIFIGEKILDHNQKCSISFYPLDETKEYILGLNNNCGFKNITLWLKSTTYSGDFLRVDSAFWKNIRKDELQVLRGQQYYIDNVYFFTEYMNNDNYLATAFHIIIRDTDDEGNLLECYQHELSYRQHFKNVEIKYFNVGICVELRQREQPPVGDQGVWCNSLHFFDVDMWVRSNGFVLTTSGLTNLAIGRFLISGILLQPVGTPDSHCPYAFYAENGYNCMLDMINVWDNSKVAYVGSGCITIGQYRSDNIAPFSVGSTGKIKTPLWGENVMDL